MKWGTKYGPEYVNRLHNMVQRNLTYEHRFICLTDDSEGFNEGIDVFPLPELDLPDGAPERGWNKLTVFPETLYDIEGTTLFLDLDIVIFDSIDCLFEEEGEFIIVNDWKYPTRITGNSSVFRFEVGKHPYVLSYFLGNLEKVREKFRNEQAYLTDAIFQNSKVTYWPEEWCRSYKYHCLPKFPTNYFCTPVIPKNCKIAIFHGNPKLQDAIDGTKLSARRFSKPAPWVSEYWR